MTKWYGSVENRLDEGVQVGELYVGMGATELCWSDRHAYTVQQIISPSRVIVTSDQVRRIDNNGMSDNQRYEYTSTPLEIGEATYHCTHPICLQFDEKELENGICRYYSEESGCNGCKFYKKHKPTNGITLIKTKRGWKQLGNERRFKLGVREEYSDPTF